MIGARADSSSWLIKLHVTRKAFNYLHKRLPQGCQGWCSAGTWPSCRQNLGWWCTICAGREIQRKPMQLPGPVQQKAIELVQEKHFCLFTWCQSSSSGPEGMQIPSHAFHWHWWKQMYDKLEGVLDTILFPRLIYLHADGQCAVKAKRAKNSDIFTTLMQAWTSSYAADW